MEIGPLSASGTARAAQTDSARVADGDVKNAFEALLLGQLLKPLEESLRQSGLFPKGAPGEIYAHFWNEQMGALLAESIEMLPGWEPEGEVTGTLEAPLSFAPPDRTSVRVQSVPSGEVASFAERLAPFEAAIEQAADAAGVAANWLRAVISQESGGHPDAVSARGAQGLMQLLPTTAAALGVRDAMDPLENISGGARYLASLFQRFPDPRVALAAYNAGPTRVESYGGIPPFRETRGFVERVMTLKGGFDALMR